MGIILCTLSHVLQMGEKFALCLAAAGIVSCLVFTITMMLILGIGLGYNYCFVDFKTRHKYVPGYYQYTVLPITPTHPRTIKYRPPYPTLYRLPQREWYQKYPHPYHRMSQNDQNETVAFNLEELNGTDFEKLNISLDLTSLDLKNKLEEYNGTDFEKLNSPLDIASYGLRNEMRYNKTLPEGLQDYYGDVNVKNKKEEISTLSPTLPPSVSPTLQMPSTITPSGKVMDKSSNLTKTILRLNGLDLFALLAKMKSENKNYTVKIETN